MLVVNKKRLLEIFEDLIQEWERAEEVVINDRSINPDKDYNYLEKKKEEYNRKFLEALGDAE